MTLKNDTWERLYDGPKAKAQAARRVERDRAAADEKEQARQSIADRQGDDGAEQGRE